MHLEKLLLEIRKFGETFVTDSDDGWVCWCELRKTPDSTTVKVRMKGKTPTEAANLCLQEIYSLLQGMKKISDELLPIAENRLN